MTSQYAGLRLPELLPNSVNWNGLVEIDESIAPADYGRLRRRGQARFPDAGEW